MKYNETISELTIKCNKLVAVTKEKKVAELALLEKIRELHNFNNKKIEEVAPLQYEVKTEEDKVLLLESVKTIKATRLEYEKLEAILTPLQLEIKQECEEVDSIKQEIQSMIEKRNRELNRDYAKEHCFGAGLLAAGGSTILSAVITNCVSTALEVQGLANPAITAIRVGVVGIITIPITSIVSYATYKTKLEESSNQEKTII